MIYGQRERGLPLGRAPAVLEHRTLADFQRWAVRRLYKVVPFDNYDAQARERGRLNSVQPRAVLGQREIGAAGGKAGPGRGKKTGSDTTRLGRGRGYVLARLDRDGFADLAAQVRVKTKSAAEAARQAGFQKRFTPADKVRRLLPKLTDAEWEQLKAVEDDRRVRGRTDHARGAKAEPGVAFMPQEFIATSPPRQTRQTVRRA